MALSRHDFREYDQIISLYSKEYGKKNYLAKGIKKIISKNSAFLEPFSLLEVEIIHGQEFDRLIKVHPVFISKSIHSNLSKLVHVQKSVKVFEELIHEGEVDVPLFNFLNSWVMFLDEAEDIGEVVWYSFLIKLFNILGFKPVLNQCVINEQHVMGGTVFFSAVHGGVMCEMCAGAQRAYQQIVLPLTHDELEIFKRMLQPTWLNEGAIIPRSIKQVVIQFGTYHTGKNF